MKDVDERIVQMQFQNGQFEKGIQTSIESLDKLKKSLDLENSAKSLKDLENAGRNFSLSKLASSVDTVAERFSTLGIIGVTALQNITNRAISTGESLLKSLTLDPIFSGFEEYETKMNSITTILTNTKSKGTTLDDVNKALSELNTYADQTIYNFAEMTRNIGTFTAAGLDLDTSVSAIKGIANLAAGSGSSAMQASSAMYQLSQALAAGKVSLMDWNSVVNAGMGGELFQNALKETAKEMGVFVDESVPFRETLQDGWLTADVLATTLSKFAEDEDLIKAATQVKTFTQLLDTMKESVQSGWATSWEYIIGDKEEATKTLTAISDAFNNVVGASSDARNATLSFWHDNGGRDALVNGLANAFSALGSVLSSVSSGFKEVFPSITGEQLVSITKNFEDFTSKLTISEETLSNIRDTVSGVFSVFKMGLGFVASLGKAFLNLLSYISPIGSSFFEITGSIGRYLKSITEAASSTESFSNVFKFLGDILRPVGDLAISVFESLAESIGFLNKEVDSNNFEDFSKKVEERFSPLTKVGEAVTRVFDGMASVMKAVAPTFSNLGTTIANAFNKISESFVNADFSTLGDIFNTGFIGVIALSVKKFIDSLTDITENSSGFIEGITGIIDGVKGSLEEFQNSLKAKTLLTLSSAIAVLAASLVALSLVDTEKMTAALGAVSTLFLELFGSMALFQKFIDVGAFGSFAKLSTFLLTLSSSILILSSAVKSLSSISWDDLVKGLTGVGVLLTELSVTLKVGNIGGIGVTTGIGLIALATGVRILASSVSAFSELDIPSLLTGLAGVGAVLLEIAGFSSISSGSLAMIPMATGITILSGAMLIFASAIERMGSMPIETIGKGLITMAGALTEIGIAASLIPPTMIAQASGLVVMSSALILLSSALNSMGSMSWEEIAKSLATLGGSLGILAASLIAMTGTIPGAMALTVVSGALALLTPSLVMLSQLSISELGMALLSLASSFAVIGIAGMALSPLVPILLGLAGAISLFGIGVAAVGAGILAFSAGLTALAAAGTAGASALVLIVTSLVSLIPMLLTQIGNGIVAFAGVISSGAPAIADAFKAVASAILDTITEITPKVVDAIVTLLTSLLKTIESNLPTIVQSGVNIIMGLLRGIRDNIGQMAAVAIEAIVAFVNAVGEQVGMVTDAAFDLIISFINALGDTIREKTPELVSAMAGLAGDAIQGFINGIWEGLGSVKDAIWNVGSSAINAMKGALDSHSPSVEFFILGGFAIAGFIKGVQNGEPEVKNTMATLGEKTIDSFESEASELKLKNVGSYVVKNIADGIEKDMTAEEVAEKKAQNIANAFQDAFSKIDLFGDTTNLEYELWEKTEGANASETEKATAKLSFLFKEYQRQIERINLAQAEYQTNVDTFGENSDNAVEAYNKLLQEQINLANTVDEINQLRSDTMDAALQAEVDKIQSQSNIDSLRYQLLESTFTDDTSEAKKSSAKIISLLNEYSNQIQQAKIAMIKYQNAITTTGESSQETVDAYENLLQSQVDIASTIKEINTLKKDININDRYKVDDELLILQNKLQQELNAAKTTSDTMTENMSMDVSKAVKDAMKEVKVTYEENAESEFGTLVENTTDIGVQMAQAIGDGLSENLSQSLTNALNSISLSTSPTGAAFTDATAEGIASGTPSVSESATSMSTSAAESTLETQPIWLQSASYILDGFKTGIDMKKPEVLTSVSKVITDSETKIKEYYENFKSCGKYLVDGFIVGIEENITRAAQKAAEMAIAAYEAAMSAIGANSPSKLFMDVGGYVASGFAIGMENGTKEVKDASSYMAEESLNSTKSALARIIDIINNDIDTEPTIRPVLDLSNVREGVMKLNTMFSRNRALEISEDMRSAEDRINSPENGAAKKTTFQFTQNNYSPKALSRIEIYRQTKNQFSAFERMVET